MDEGMGRIMDGFMGGGWVGEIRLMSGIIVY